MSLAGSPQPAGQAGGFHRVTFTGKASEYFGIWIVNVLLTILTLGIYSAWAKVRRNRYFYGNSFIDGHSFGGWKSSSFGDLNQHGTDSIKFWTRTKTVTSRWPSGIKDGAEFVMPTMK